MRKTIPICTEHLDLEYYPHFFAKDLSDYYLEQLKLNLFWQEEFLLIFGREIKVPRLIAWYGDEGTDYSYSGVSHKPLAWNETLLEIKQILQQRLGRDFNSALANFYRNGQDSMGWHADNEPELGKQPLIASVSFGERRPFYLRHKKKQENLKIFLEHGSLLVMKGKTQDWWKHALPKSRLCKNPRVNLTFRTILR